MLLLFLDDLNLTLFLVCEFPLQGTNLCKYFKRRNACRSGDVTAEHSNRNQKRIVYNSAKAGFNGKTATRPEDKTSSLVKKRHLIYTKQHALNATNCKRRWMRSWPRNPRRCQTKGHCLLPDHLPGNIKTFGRRHERAVLLNFRH